MWLKQSTLAVISFGPFLDELDGITEQTGLVSALDHATTGIKISKNGGAMAVRSGAAATTYDSYGSYRVTLSTTDTNALGTLRVIYSDKTTNLPVWQDFMVLDGQKYDGLVAAVATGVLPVDTTKWSGQPVAVVDASGFPKVTIKNDTAAGSILTSAGVVTSVATTATATNVTTVNGLAPDVITEAAIQNGAINRATFAADTGLQTIRSGTALNGGSSTVDLDAGASSVTDFYVDCWLYLTSGTGAGQARRIFAYDGTFKVANVSPVWATNPAAGTTFAILPFGNVDLGRWLSAVPNALVVGRVDASVGAMATDVITNTALNNNAVTEIQLNLATSAALATAQADLTNIRNVQLPAALTTTTGLMKVSVEALLDDAAAGVGGVEAATDLRTSAKTIVRGTASGSPTITSLPASDLPSAVDGHYKGRIVIFTSGVLADQATSISEYVGSTKTLTIVAITSAPAAGTTFVII
jgi:hypothetical protein